MPIAHNPEHRTASSARSSKLAGLLKPFESWTPAGTGKQIIALARYLTQTEVHTYAFSVAANAILSLFPFIVLMLTLSRTVFHSPVMVNIVGDMMRNFMPIEAKSQDFIVRNMQFLAHPKKGAQMVSLVMLLITSTGVFLPLEVALNRVWGVTEDRSYLHNQIVSLGLAFAVGVLALTSVAFSAAQQTVLGWLFFGHTDNFVFNFIGHAVLKLCAVAASILLFFLIYWILPRRKIPPRAVMPTAIVVGLLWELAKLIYIRVLPLLDFRAVYGPFYISVGLMMWAFLSGLLLLAGAQFSATRYALRETRLEEKKEVEQKS